MTTIETIPFTLNDGRIVQLQCIGEKHYLVWIGGEPITEVQCIPTDEAAWYWTDSDQMHAMTLDRALQRGIALAKRVGTTYGREWTEKALKAMDAENKLP